MRGGYPKKEGKDYLSSFRFFLFFSLTCLFKTTATCNDIAEARAQPYPFNGVLSSYGLFADPSLRKIEPSSIIHLPCFRRFIDALKVQL